MGRKVEALWPIFKIHHQKSRYLFDLFYRRKAISRELYDYCIKEKIADANLIAKWKKQGYENLCCLRLPDSRHQLRDQLHLPCAQEQVGGRQDCGVRPLWLQRLLWIGKVEAAVISFPCNFVFKLHDFVFAK